MYYLSVDEIPIYNWNKIFSKGEFLYCYKVKKRKHNYKEIIAVCDALLDDFTNELGVNKKVKQYNALRVKSAKLKAQYIKTSNRMLVNEIELLDGEIEKLKKLIFSQDKGDFDKIHVILQQWYGMKIDLRTTTVKEYYNILKAYERANKAHRHSRGGRSR